jgi:hypothetical protein
MGERLPEADFLLFAEGAGMQTSPLNQPPSGKAVHKAKALTPEQIRQINDCLVAIGDYGEIRLIVQRGELRYINKVESLRAAYAESKG